MKDIINTIKTNMTRYKQNLIKHKWLIVMVAILIFAPSYFLIGADTAKADQYEEKIKKLRQDNAYYQTQSLQLRKKAETLEAEVAIINQQKQQIQVNIDQTNHQIQVLNKEITRLEKMIADNREALGDVITRIYMASKISTIERLASSRAITEFIDEEAKNHSLRQGLSDKLKQIKSDREAVNQKKSEQEKVLAERKVQMTAQVALENEKQRILNQTKGDENLYRKMAEDNNTRIEKLRLEQKETNCKNNGGVWTEGKTCFFRNKNSKISKGIPGGGGYPGKWAFAPIDAYVDPWGLYSRECVSYVAWKIHDVRNGAGRFEVIDDGKKISSPLPHFSGMGNANQWPATATRHGIAHGRAPKAGAAAVSMEGYYGHVMYVESVNSDGTITVSDYNLMWDGNYRIYDRSPAGLIYIYF